MSEEAIIHALNTIREANDKSHEDLREFIREGNKGIHLVMDANSLVTAKSIDILTEKQEKQNSNVAKLQEKSDNRQVVIDDFRRLEANMANIKKRWLYLLAGAVGFVLAIMVVYDAIGLRGIIDIFK